MFGLIKKLKEEQIWHPLPDNFISIPYFNPYLTPQEDKKNQTKILETCIDDLVCQEVYLPIANLPEEFNGYQIGFITDSHLDGSREAFEHHKTILRYMLKSEIDVLVNGGDMFKSKKSDITIEQAREIGDFLNKSEVILLAVPGNHENGDLRNHYNTVMMIMGYHVLNNLTHPVRKGSGSINFVGIDDTYQNLNNGIIVPHNVKDMKKNAINIGLTHSIEAVNEHFRLYIDSKGFTYPGRFDAFITGHYHPALMMLKIGKFKIPYGKLTMQYLQDHKNINNAKVGGITHLDSRGVLYVGNCSKHKNIETKGFAKITLVRYVPEIK
jgi:predicted phosphodiesterase